MPTKEEMKIAQGIHVRECGEPLVDIRRYNKQIVVKLEETSKKMQGLKVDRCFLRDSAAIRLSLAQGFLPGKYRFKIIDGYRPLKAQKEIYKNLLKLLRKRHPEMTERELVAETDKWVSNPEKIVPPHTTGGTIDLTIVDGEGIELDMGTAVNKVDVRSYTSSRDITARARKNRGILIKAMKKAGFVNDPMEWWHWSYGDWRWAYENKRESIYKPI